MRGRGWCLSRRAPKQQFLGFGKPYCQELRHLWLLVAPGSRSFDDPSSRFQCLNPFVDRIAGTAGLGPMDKESYSVTEMQRLEGRSLRPLVCNSIVKRLFQSASRPSHLSHV